MKILHVKNGRVAAISFPNESLPDYGAKVEVSLDTKVSVGDVYEIPAEVPSEPVEPPKESEATEPPAKTSKRTKAA